LETDPTRMCELLIGLPEVNILEVDDVAGGTLFVQIATRARRPACPSCGVLPTLKDRDPVLLVDLHAFGRRTRLICRKRRFRCVDPDFGAGTFPETEPKIGRSDAYHRPGRPLGDRAIFIPTPSESDRRARLISS
jgi:transposase